MYLRGLVAAWGNETWGHLRDVRPEHVPGDRKRLSGSWCPARSPRSSRGVDHVEPIGIEVRSDRSSSLDPRSPKTSIDVDKQTDTTERRDRPLKNHDWPPVVDLFDVVPVGEAALRSYRDAPSLDPQVAGTHTAQVESVSRFPNVGSEVQRLEIGRRGFIHQGSKDRSRNWLADDRR